MKIIITPFFKFLLWLWFVLMILCNWCSCFNSRYDDLNPVVGEGIGVLGKDLFLASSESDQSEIQKTFRDPPASSESYRDLAFRETFIADPEPGGAGWGGFGSERRTLLPPERGRNDHHADMGGHHANQLGSHHGNRLGTSPVGQPPRIQLNPGYDSRCSS